MNALSPVLRTFESPHGEELEEVACPLCNGRDAALMYEAKDLLYGLPGAYPVVRCQQCEFVYVNPRPTFASLGAHYPDDYHCYIPPEASPAPIRPMIRSMMRDQTLRRLKMIEDAIGRVPAEAQLLDVGCGLNDLLRVIHEERGALGTGLDMKDTMVARIRDELKMPVVEGTLQTANLPSNHFDLVTMLEYLEHEPDPRAVLSHARRVLKTGGHVGIEIPHTTGWPARAFKNRWANLDVPRHLVFFDEKTLTRTLREEGFEVVSYKPFAVPLFIGISVMFWLGAHNNIRNTFSTPFFSGLLGLPFLPALPWLNEFAFVVARAV